MSRRKKVWSPDEIDRLHRLYPKHGPVGTARYLDRTPSGVRYQARKQGLLIGLGHDVVLISEVAALAKRSDSAVRDEARRDGVARRVGPRMWVPRKWAEAYIEAARRRSDVDALRGAWLTTAEFARRLGVNPHSVTNARREGGDAPIAKAVKGVRTAKATSGYLLWHPLDVQGAERIYRAEVQKYRSDAWISLAEAAQRWGVPEYIIRDRRRKVRKRDPLHAVLHSLTVERDATRWGRPAMLRADEVEACADEVRAAWRAGGAARPPRPMTGGGQSTRSSSPVSDGNPMGQRRRSIKRGHDRASSRHDPGHAVPR